MKFGWIFILWLPLLFGCDNQMYIHTSHTSKNIQNSSLVDNEPSVQHCLSTIFVDAWASEQGNIISPLCSGDVSEMEVARVNFISGVIKGYPLAQDLATINGLLAGSEYSIGNNKAGHSELATSFAIENTKNKIEDTDLLNKEAAKERIIIPRGNPCVSDKILLLFFDSGFACGTAGNNEDTEQSFTFSFIITCKFGRTDIEAKQCKNLALVEYNKYITETHPK